MDEQNFGGITIKEVITFQTQIMMGAQFGRLVKKNVSEEDIIIACLRMGWNDAFRHTSKNKTSGKTTVLEKEEKDWRKNKEHKEPYDDFICEILREPKLQEAFLEFAKAGSTVDKIGVIKEYEPQLKSLLGEFKETDGDKGLCFGHYQKMFNIAIKLYVCLYLCREWLEIKESAFYKEILQNIHNADCPIDSIILESLAKDTRNKEFTRHKWSRYGTEEPPYENYKTVQEKISGLKKAKEKSRLYYDFIAWKQQRK